MDIVKKNLLSIICGVVAVLAIVAAFFPMSGYFDALKLDLEKRQKVNSELTNLLNKPRTYPITDPNGGTAKVPLNGFPTDDLIKQARAARLALVQQSKGLADKAVEVNRRQFQFETAADAAKLQLLANALPVPAGAVPLRFKDAWREELRRVREKVLMGGTPPNEADVAEADKALKKSWEAKLQYANGQEMNRPAVDAGYAADSAKLIAQLRAQRATQHLIYVEPDALALPQDVEANSSALAPSKIWFAHVSVWVTEDVCRAIREANTAPPLAADGTPAGKAPANVTEAPVKRLVRLDVPATTALYVGLGNVDAGDAPASGGRGGFRGATVAPAGDASAAAAALSAPPAKNIQASPTGRVSNMMYDVIRFTIVADVDESQLPVVISRLSTNRLTTVRKVDLIHLDPDSIAQAGYVYGNVPVSQVSLDCETIMLRDWTAPLMPPTIKAILGITTDAAGAAGGSAR